MFAATQVYGGMLTKEFPQQLVMEGCAEEMASCWSEWSGISWKMIRDKTLQMGDIWSGNKVGVFEEQKET